MSVSCRADASPQRADSQRVELLHTALHAQVDGAVAEVHLQAALDGGRDLVADLERLALGTGSRALEGLLDALGMRLVERLRSAQR